MDTTIVILSLVLFPVFIGVILFILTYLFTKDEEAAFEEGCKLTKIMWAVLAVGALIYMFSR
jgi:VIT1/CCC1 family predicted Fe2+/Mn2+ transporter